MTEFFATIRPESKYSNQQPVDKSGNLIPFAVALDFDDPFWPIKGGMGGNYMFFDVELWVNTGSSLERIGIHSLAEESIPLSRLQADKQ